MAPQTTSVTRRFAPSTQCFQALRTIVKTTQCRQQPSRKSLSQQMVLQKTLRNAQFRESTQSQPQSQPFLPDRPLAEHSRARPAERAHQQGIRLSAYLDDRIILGSTFEETLAHTRRVKTQLEQLGRIINEEKSVMTPTQQLQHLGFQINTLEMQLKIPGAKLRDLRRSVTKILATPIQTPRIMHSITMRIVPLAWQSFRKLVYASTDGIQELVGDTSPRLGSTGGASRRRATGAEMVASPHSPMERPLLDNTNASEHALCRCQRHGLGCRLEQCNGSAEVDASGAAPLDQLARADGNFSRIAVFPLPQGHVCTSHDGQYDSQGICEQTGRHAISPAESTSRCTMALLPPSSPHVDSAAHPGHRKRGRRPRIPTLREQESVADSSDSLRSNSATLRPKRCRLVRRQGNKSSPEIRLVEVRCYSDSDRRDVNLVDQVSPSDYQSPVEFDPAMSGEDSAGATTDSDDDSPALARRNLVPDVALDGDAPADLPRPASAHPRRGPKLPFTMDKSTLETLRVAHLRRRFADRGYTGMALDALLEPLLDSENRRPVYKHAQWHFIDYCQAHNVDANAFTSTDLINCLTRLHSAGYGINTLLAYKSGILHLHHDAQSLRDAADLHQLVKNLKRRAPPVPQHRPAVDLAPTLDYLRRIPSSTATALNLLRDKTCFLLAMAAFLRPSDLARIDLAQCTIDSTRMLHLHICSPKERRRGRAIIKTVSISPNTRVPALCPVSAFDALREHPITRQGTGTHLFVLANRPTESLVSTTISTCLRRLVRLSTDVTPTPSVRSIASDLALSRGASLDDVVTTGNWSSSSVFENHYRRQRLAQTNITHATLQ